MKYSKQFVIAYLFTVISTALAMDQEPYKPQMIPGAQLPITQPNEIDALFHAIHQGDIVAVKKLFEQSTDAVALANATNENNISALSAAAKRGNREIIRAIIQPRAPVNYIPLDLAFKLTNATMNAKDKSAPK